MIHSDGIEEGDKYIFCIECEMWNKHNPDQMVQTEHHYMETCKWKKKVKEVSGKKILDAALEKIQADMIRRLEG